MTKIIERAALPTKSIRVDNSVAAIKQSFIENLTYVQGKFDPIATKYDYYMALAYTIRDRFMDLWARTAKTYLEGAVRTLCYLSAEFFIGPQMAINIHNMGIYENVRKAIEELGLNFDEIIDYEPEPGLGSGGLGRLAACYLESSATLRIPTIGYGVHYEFGIFNQEIHNGWQVERTDKWLHFGNPWEIPRPEIFFDIKFGGHTENYVDKAGRFRVKWTPSWVAKSVACDIPVVGYKTGTANFIRLWKSEACESFDFQAFNVGDYYKSVQEKVVSENITKVLYPNDEPLAGKKLRLQQQYFFVSSSLQDMIRIYQQKEKNLKLFHKKYVIQLNDTHPSIAIAELMRLLVDEHLFKWDDAWDIVKQTFCYTNHTLMAEALERWPVQMFAEMLPRHFEIISEINRRFLEEVKARFPHDADKLRRISIIDESHERSIRMAHLACVGSYSINGVSELHTNLLKQSVLQDYYELWPKKFSNKTNGVSPRKFLSQINPDLANLISETIGDKWIANLHELVKLEKFAEDPAFQKKWYKAKSANKKRLAEIIKRSTGVVVDSDSLFDIQAKRFHEYKRQLLNVLHIIMLYEQIRQSTKIPNTTPRTFIFAGKAAPNYVMAKLIIKLINEVANVVNNDPLVRGLLKVVFLPNYNVKSAQWIYPAADLSEQISIAGKEASGTGNMKFSLNGALTIGTLDGANIEIREEVGDENFFLFGLTSTEVMDLFNSGYRPRDFINKSRELEMVLDLIDANRFSKNEPEIFKPILDHLRNFDNYLVCADFQSYIDTQARIGQLYKDRKQWTKLSILNVAKMGKFSSDRALLEYNTEVWNIEHVFIK